MKKMARRAVHAKHPKDGALLRRLQKETFDYFLYESNSKNGLVRDKTEKGWPASISATGLALASYPIGVERAFLSRSDAVKRTLATLRFFADSKQGTAPNATGYRGFYYHFLDMKTGRRAWKCELSTIDSALLLAGALTAAMYFDRDTRGEAEIRALADGLYRRADWQWAQNRNPKVSHGWKPETGFLKFTWEGYSEALLLYVLGLGSPTYPLPDTSYPAWCSTYAWKTIYGIDFLYAGPLFIHQFSHLWIDFAGIQDDFMREKGIDYAKNTRRATLIQQQYAIRNPHHFTDYGKYCWGITASDGPGPTTLRIAGIERTFFDYIARGVPYGPDDGTVAPWVVAASLPFAPEIVLPTIRHFTALRLREMNPYGFKATYNPTFPANDRQSFGWVTPYHFGLDQGPVVMMIENYRSGLLWRLMKRCPYLIRGLRRAGFRGGWLDRAGKSAADHG